MNLPINIPTKTVGIAHAPLDTVNKLIFFKKKK